MARVLRGAWRLAPPPTDELPGDVSQVAPLLIRTGSGALAWRRLAGSSLAACLEADPLHRAYRLHALEVPQRERRLAAVVEWFRRAGVEPIVAGGWAAARLYPEPGLRPWSDLDVYCDPGDGPLARAALTARADPGTVAVSGLGDLDDRDPGPLRARCHRVPAGDLEVTVLGDEDRLRLLSLHMLRYGVARPLWLCDVAAAVEAARASFDWDYFASGDRRRTQAALCGLVLAERLLGAELRAVPPALRPRLPGWVVPAVLREWGTIAALRVPLGRFLRRPGGLFGELRRRWPNAVEATVGVGAAFDGRPRLPLQLALSATRAAQLGAALARRRHRGAAVVAAAAGR